MKVLICLFAVLAVANAAYLHNNVYSSGIIGRGIIGGAGISAGNYIAPSVAYPTAIRAVHPAVYQTAAYAAPAHVYNPAIYNSAPLVGAGHGLSYGLNNGLSYGNTYALGGSGVYGYGGFKH